MPRWKAKSTRTKLNKPGGYDKPGVSREAALVRILTNNATPVLGTFHVEVHGTCICFFYTRNTSERCEVVNEFEGQMEMVAHTHLSAIFFP